MFILFTKENAFSQVDNSYVRFKLFLFVSFLKGKYTKV